MMMMMLMLSKFPKQMWDKSHCIFYLTQVHSSFQLYFHSYQNHLIILINTHLNYEIHSIELIGDLGFVKLLFGLGFLGKCPEHLILIDSSLEVK